MVAYHILVTEADENKYQIIQKAFARHDESHFVVNMHDAKSLLLYLSGKIKYNHQLPDLLLFNAESVVVDGRHALELISSNPFFNNIPAIVYGVCDDSLIQISRAHGGVQDIEPKTYASINADLFVADLITYLVETASHKMSDH